MTPLTALGREEAREMDRLAEEEFHLPLALMMENAGRAFAAFVCRRAGVGPKRVLVLAGKGGNGGGALAAARHLLNADWTVEAALAVPPETLGGATYLQFEMLRAAGGIVRDGRSEPVDFDAADVVIDGLLGYHARGEPRPPMDRLLADANAAPGRRIALDVPTGVDPDSGEAHGKPFLAEATLMLGLPKTGVLREAGPRFAGELWLADIGLPAAAYRKLGAVRPRFDEAGISEFSAHSGDA